MKKSLQRKVEPLSLPSKKAHLPSEVNRNDEIII